MTTLTRGELLESFTDDRFPTTHASSLRQYTKARMSVKSRSELAKLQ